MASIDIIVYFSSLQLFCAFNNLLIYVKSVLAGNGCVLSVLSPVYVSVFQGNGCVLSMLSRVYVSQVMDVCSVTSTLGKIASDADVIYGHLVDVSMATSST